MSPDFMINSRVVLMYTRSNCIAIFDGVSNKMPNTYCMIKGHNNKYAHFDSVYVLGVQYMKPLRCQTLFF